MNKIFSYFLQKTFLVNLITALIVLVGLISAVQMKRDLIPSFSSPTINVVAYLHGASSTEVEKFLTIPLESALKGIAEVKEINSTSNNSQSQITIQFKSSAKNIPEKIEDIRSKIQSIQSKLPQYIDPIQVTQSKNETIWLMFAGLFNIDETNPSHRQWLRKTIQEIEKIDGVNSVYDDIRKYEIRIDFNSKKLAESALTLEYIRSKILEQISVYPIGSIKNGNSLISIEIPKNEINIELLKNIPLKSHTFGNDILLGNIAQITLNPAEKKRITLFNGESYVGLQIFKDASGDVLTLKAKIQDLIKKTNSELPKPLELKIIVDGPSFLEKQLTVLKNNAFIGLILVLVILTFFLGTRTALATAFGIPLSYLGTAIVLNLFGIPLDLISIIAMLILIGILVDDAIIISERYAQNIEDGMIKSKAALNSVTTLFLPVTATITTTMIAFSPILFIHGELRELLIAIPIVILSALFVSWFECFFILPNHLLHFINPQKKTAESNWYKQFKNFYARSLSFTLKFRYLAILISLVFFASSIYLATQKMKSNFSVQVGGERLHIIGVLKESSSFEETHEKTAHIQKYLKELSKNPNIRGIGTVLGQLWVDGKYKDGFEFIRFNISISDDVSQPILVKNQLKDQLNIKLKELLTNDFERLSVETQFNGKEEEMKSMLSIFIYGDQTESAFKIRNEIQSKLKSQKDVVSIDINEDQVQKTWTLNIIDGILLKYGLTPSQISDQIRHKLNPIHLAHYRSNGEEIQILLKNSDLEDPNFEEVTHINFYSQQNSNIPSKVLGSWEEKDALKYINRKNGQLFFRIDLKYNENIENFVAFKKTISSELEKIQAHYTGFTISLEDADPSSEDNKTWAIKIFLICILLIVFILALMLESIFQPILVALSIPFGVSGVICALYFHNLDLGFMVIIGLLGVAGVSVNNSLVMIDTINRISKLKNYPTALEIINGATQRLRAVTITTLTTIGGVFPMAYGIGGDAGFTRPLAFSLGWGLMTSTVITLFMLPVFLMIKNDIVNLTVYLWKFKNKKLNEDSVDKTQPIRWSFLKKPSKTQSSGKKIDGNLP